MRAFVGIDITDASTVDALTRVRARLGAPAGPRHDHITLSFLGEVGTATVRRAADALQAVRFAPFDAHIAGLGAFPSPSRPRVIWAGVREGAGKVSGLAADVAAALAPLGVRPPSRHVAHVTVSRVKSGSVAPASVMSELANTEFGVQRVESFSLKRSDPAGGAHVHTTLHTVGASP